MKVGVCTDFFGEIDENRVVRETGKAYNLESERYMKYAGNEDLKIDKTSKWAISDEITKRKLIDLIKPVCHRNKDVYGVDAASGDGVWSCRMLNMFPNLKIIGYDLAPNLIRKAQRRSEELNLDDRAEFKVGDIRDMNDLESNSVDFIFCIYDGLNHVPNPRNTALKEFYRILKPCGRVLATVHSKSDFTPYICEPEEVQDWKEFGDILILQMKSGRLHILYSHRYNYEELIAEFKAAGFRVVEIFGIDVVAKDLLESLRSDERARWVDELLDLELKMSKVTNFWNKAVHIGIIAEKR
mgnify:CR=1 FL=1